MREGGFAVLASDGTARRRLGNRQCTGAGDYGNSEVPEEVGVAVGAGVIKFRDLRSNCSACIASYQNYLLSGHLDRNFMDIGVRWWYSFASILRGGLMNENFDNRRRVFADLVFVDAWHRKFTEEVESVNLHVDVSFGTARVGGDSDIPVQFRLSLKRAEVVIIVPESEPVSIDRASVSRDSPVIEAKRSKSYKRKRGHKLAASAKGALSKLGIGGSVKLNGEFVNENSKSENLDINDIVRMITSTTSQTADADYRWKLEPRVEPVLNGSPWDPIEEPRLGSGPINY